jgi:SAM-dependent methyltransferase
VPDGRLYDSLAPIYDAWQSADGMTPFALVAHAHLEPLLARGHTPPASFIDLGCGTGELLLALRRAHPDWRLAGVDASPGMLAVAAGKPDAGRIAWVRARVDEPLPVAGPFDAAGAFYDTLNHLPDAEALSRAFAAASAVLRPGALLIFDLTNPLGFELWWRKGTNRWSGKGWALAVETRYDRHAHAGHARVTITSQNATTRFDLDERWFSDQEVDAALETAGLTPERSDPWSPFDIDAPGKTLWIARKQMR